MNDPRVRLLSEPGEPWLVDFDRRRHELLINPDVLGVRDITTPADQDLVADVGAALIAHWRAHPDASDQELAAIAIGVSGRSVTGIDED